MTHNARLQLFLFNKRVSFNYRWQPPFCAHFKCTVKHTFDHVYIGKLFPLLFQVSMGPYSFTLFIAILILFGIYLWKMLPETKGKTYDDLYRHFKVYDIESNGQTKAKPLPKVCWALICK